MAVSLRYMYACRPMILLSSATLLRRHSLEKVIITDPFRPCYLGGGGCNACPQFEFQTFHITVLHIVVRISTQVMLFIVILLASMSLFQRHVAFWNFTLTGPLKLLVFACSTSNSRVINGNHPFALFQSFSLKRLIGDQEEIVNDKGNGGL